MRRLILTILLAVTVACATGCPENKELRESEATAIDELFKTGVTFERDPFVRAETFRVIEFLADPALSEYADDGLDDKSAMVRLASLRATLATEADDAAAAASRVFARGDAQERRVVLNAVAEYDEGPSRRELLGRALRSKDSELRRLAFEESLISRIDQAIANDDAKELERNLYPELGRYIGLDTDPALAALAARKFLEVGQTDRIDPILKKLKDRNAPLEERVKAGKILVGARAKPAEEAFLAILQRYEDLLADNSLGVPDDIVPPELRRIAVLGAVAVGNENYVKPAQAYINNVSEAEAVEVLEALAPNPSPDAALSLKVAMQDARRKVRLRAIELYEKRADADAEALVSSIKGADYETQRRLAGVLYEQFPEQWITSLRSQLQRPSTMEATLQLLRDVVTTEEEAKAIIVPLKDVLRKILKEEKEERKALASYFLAITTEDAKEALAVADSLDSPTRYAYLEFLVRTSPDRHVALFRKYLYDDLYVVRLMSAAGLWRTLGAEGAQAEANKGAPPAEGEANEGEPAEESAE